jgi:hypothetical protein
MLVIKPLVSYMLGKHSITDLCPQTDIKTFWKNVAHSLPSFYSTHSISNICMAKIALLGQLYLANYNAQFSIPMY